MDYALFSPTPIVSWIKLQSGIHLQHYDDHNTTLILPNVTDDDEGTYQCKGQNSAGKDEETFYVGVEGWYYLLFIKVCFP